MERYNGIKGERQEARQEMRQNIAVQTEGIETKRENIHSAAGEPAKAKRENSASVAEERTEVKKESGLPDAGAADRTKREANSVQPKVQAMTGVSQEAQSRQPEAPVMDLYDLFGYTQEERRLAERGLKPERKKGSKSKPKKPVQASLFVLPEDGTGMEADKGKTEAGAAITPEEAKEMEEIIRVTAEVEAAPVETTAPKAEDTASPQEDDDPEDAVYRSLDWETNPPINGFYETMMSLTPEQRAELRRLGKTKMDQCRQADSRDIGGAKRKSPCGENGRTARY